MFNQLQRMPVHFRFCYFLKLCLLNINCFNILIFSFSHVCLVFFFLLVFASVAHRCSYLAVLCCFVVLVVIYSCSVFIMFVVLLLLLLLPVVVLSPAPRLIFFDLLYSCQLLLGTMAAFLSRPSARSGRTLFGQLGRGRCCGPRLCIRCLSGRCSWGSRSAPRRSVAGILRRS